MDKIIYIQTLQAHTKIRLENTIHKEFITMKNNINVKNTIILTAVDIRLSHLDHSPKRCARNLMELGIKHSAHRLSSAEKLAIWNLLLTLCQNEDLNAIRELFVQSFLC